jgi:predicted nucleic acid-binding protein
MLYLDTSVLVAALINEPHTRRVQDWLGGQESGTIAISDWVAAEFSSALSIKLRTAGIDTRDRAEALAIFGRLASESLTVLPVSRSHFRAAARFADRHALGLRAGDALHLTICAEAAAALCTLDRRQCEAAAALAIAANLLRSPVFGEDPAGEVQ